MIWALRLVIEKHWEYNQPLFIAFLDLEKAFDRVGPTQRETVDGDGGIHGTG